MVDWKRVFDRGEHEQATARELAERYGVSRIAVYAAMKRHDVRPKPPPPGAFAMVDWYEVLVKRRLHQEMTHAELARELGCKVSTIQRRLWKFRHERGFDV